MAMRSLVRGTVLVSAVGGAYIYAVDEAKQMWHENEMNQKIRNQYESYTNSLGLMIPFKVHPNHDICI